MMADHSTNIARFARRRLAGAVAFTIVGLVVCFWVLVGKPEAESSQQVEPRRPLVDVMIAAPAEHAIWVQTQGTVEPVTRVSLMAQVSGKVEAVSEAFREGRFFKKGDALLQLETADYDFAIARAAAQEAAAAQRLAEERGRNLQAKREWRDLGSSEANELFLRKPQLYAAETALEAARADVEAAKLALARTTLKAPFDGRLEKKLVDVGQFVAPGASLAQVYATDRVEVLLPISESQLALLALPLFETSLETYPDVTLTARFGAERWQWQGQITRMQASIDRDSRATFAIAEVKDPFNEGVERRPPLTPGLFVEASIRGKPIQQSIELPATALRGDNTVLRLEAGDRLERLPVELLRRAQERVWVRGIAAGERIVLEQSSLLSSGTAVEVAEVRRSGSEP